MRDRFRRPCGNIPQSCLRSCRLEDHQGGTTSSSQHADAARRSHHSHRCRISPEGVQLEIAGMPAELQSQANPWLIELGWASTSPGGPGARATWAASSSVACSRRARSAFSVPSSIARVRIPSPLRVLHRRADIAGDDGLVDSHPHEVEVEVVPLQRTGFAASQARRRDDPDHCVESGIARLCLLEEAEHLVKARCPNVLALLVKLVVKELGIRGEVRRGVAAPPPRERQAR